MTTRFIRCCVAELMAPPLGPAAARRGVGAPRRPAWRRRAGRGWATARTPPASGRSRTRRASDSRRSARGSMRTGANNAIVELGGLFGAGVLALEEFKNTWQEL